MKSQVILPIFDKVHAIYVSRAIKLILSENVMKKRYLCPLFEMVISVKYFIPVNYV